MAKEVVTKVIGGRSFSIYPMSPVKALAVLTRVLKQIGGPLGVLLQGFGKTGDVVSMKSMLDKKMNFDAIGDALGDLFTQLDEAIVERTMLDLLKFVQVDNRELIIETDFLGEPDIMIQVAVESFKANYSGFFTGSSALLSSVMKKATT